MLLVTNEFYLFSKSRLSRDLHLERLEVAASFQTHGHFCFMTFACVLPGTCLPPKASLTKLYSRLRPRLKVTSQTDFPCPRPISIKPSCQSLSWFPTFILIKLCH